MSEAQEAPVVEQPQAAVATPTDAAASEPRKPRRTLEIVAIIVAAVVVAGALFGGGIAVGAAIAGSHHNSQGQFGPRGNGGFPGQNGGGQNGFGQNGTGQGGFPGQNGQNGSGQNQNGQNGTGQGDGSNS